MKLLYSMGRPEQTLGADIPLDRGSELMMRTIESREGLTARLLSNQAAESKEGQINADPLIQGLIDRLPKPDGPWPLEERAKWLRTAVSIFDLVYKDAEQREIAVVINKPEDRSLKTGSSRPPAAF